MKIRRNMSPHSSFHVSFLNVTIQSLQISLSELICHIMTFLADLVPRADLVPTSVKCDPNAEVTKVTVPPSSTRGRPQKRSSSHRLT